MKKKALLLAVAALAALPSLAAAMCTDGHTPVVRTTTPCEQGQVWDETKQACVVPGVS